MARHIWASTIVITALVTSSVVGATASATATTDGAEVITLPDGPNSIVVVDDTVADPAAVAELVADASTADESEVAVLDVVDAIVAPLDAEAVAELAALPGVSVIDDQELTIDANSTQSNAPWNLSRLDQQFLPVDTGYSYPSSAGAGVRVYVIDSGVTPNAQFGNRLLSGPTYVADGLGTRDCNGHGTHVAGTVASSSWGVAKSASIVPVRVFDCGKSTTLSVVLSALDWVGDNHPAGTPGVINLSLGGAQNDVFDNAIAEVAARGLVVVVAAGNHAVDACLESPASAPIALTVGATTIQDARASFSDFGPCLDVFAPGDQITSVRNDGSSSPVIMGGTSMAAPHVAGVAALIWSTNPSQSPRTVESTLITQSIQGRVTSAGTGSPNRLLSSLPLNTLEVPGAVSGVTATRASATSARVTWNAPTVNPGKVTDYTIQFRRVGITTWLTGADGVSTNRSATISGLVSSNDYSVRVRAESVAGSGPFSSEATLSPGSVTASATAVYRFWSDEKQTHFYTASAAERDFVMRNYPSFVWRYEGVGFGAFAEPTAGTVPVFRFWSNTGQSHFYTASAVERDFVIANYPDDVWAYEGVAFHVYPVTASTSETRVVDRFWSPRHQNHFYTASASESEFVKQAYPDFTWTFEGSAFRVPNATPPAAPLR